MILPIASRSRILIPFVIIIIVAFVIRCGRTEVQHKETETGCLPRNEEIRKKERDKDKELMKEGLSAGDV